MRRSHHCQKSWHWGPHGWDMPSSGPPHLLVGEEGPSIELFLGMTSHETLQIMIHLQTEKWFIYYSWRCQATWKQQIWHQPRGSSAHDSHYWEESEAAQNLKRVPNLERVRAWLCSGNASSKAHRVAAVGWLKAGSLALKFKSLSRAYPEHCVWITVWIALPQVTNVWNGDDCNIYLVHSWVTKANEQEHMVPQREHARCHVSLQTNIISTSGSVVSIK